MFSSIQHSLLYILTITRQIKVKPNARTNVLVQLADGTWLAQVKAVPVHGKANEELKALLARHFGCSKQAVSIRSGAGSRLKLVRIEADSGDGIKRQSTSHAPQ